MRNGRVRATAAAASAAAHMVVFLLLALRLGHAPSAVEPPAMDVELVRPAATSQLRKRPAVSRPPVAPRSRAHDDRSSPPAEIPPIAILPSPPGTAPAVALREILGCRHADLLGLSREQRERCLQRLGAPAVTDKVGAAPKLDLDPSHAFAPDPDPYLTRRPKRGCKLKTGGEISVMGQQGETAGVTCAWRF